MTAALTDIKERHEICRLSGGGKHGRRPALQLRYFGRHHIIGGILQPGIKISAGLQIEKLSHILPGFISEGGGLDNGNLARLPVPRGIARLHTFCTCFIFTHFNLHAAFFAATRCEIRADGFASAT